MRVTVCQMDDDPAVFVADWAALRRHVQNERSELVLLPEMPFGRWFGTGRTFRQAAWDAAVAEHGSWQERLGELGPATVLSTAPVDRAGKRLNEAFIWSDGAARFAHDKRYLPDEEGFFEASWYQPGDGRFELAQVGGAQIGFQICTELWRPEEARLYGVAGAEIIAVPRATPAASRERWLVGGRAAAILAGAFCLSSNRAGFSCSGMAFAGTGWIIDPDGEILAVTSEAEPFMTYDIDLDQAREAKGTYPRYVS